MWVFFHFPRIPVGGSVVASMFPPISWECIIWHLRQNLDPSFSPQFFSYYSVQTRKIAIVQPRHNYINKKKAKKKKKKLGIREQKESYMSSRRGLKMKEKEMREGITVLKMKTEQWCVRVFACILWRRWSLPSHSKSLPAHMTQLQKILSSLENRELKVANQAQGWFVLPI